MRLLRKNILYAYFSSNSLNSFFSIALNARCSKMSCSSSFLSAINSFSIKITRNN